MANTPTAGLPYPQGSDAPNLPYWLEALATALDARLLNDSGWVDITVLSGFAPMAGAEKPQLRLSGGIVRLRGGFTSAGISANGTFTVGRIASAAHRPPMNLGAAVGSSSGAAVAAMLVVASSGDLQLRTSATLGAYYTLGGIAFHVT